MATAVEQEGRDAYAAGIEPRRCPYKDAFRRDAWLKGYFDARREHNSPD
ncbi:Rmf/CrpP family protein [Hansschlegelia sp. KR7-227]|jgi:ribosome modulation factor